MWCASAPTVRLSGMSVRLSVLSVWVSVVCVSAFNPHDETFRYQVLSNRFSEACTMCFGDECWELQKDRCRYYAEVNEAFAGGEAGGVPGDVDGLVHDMVGQAAASWTTLDCIPLVSLRTDCNKENICVGCQSCSCDASGKWDCKEVKRCRVDPDLDVDHRVLVSVAEILKDGKTTRKKRSTENKTVNVAAPTKISYEKIAEWLYGVGPSVRVNPEETGHRNNETHTIKTATTDMIKIDNIKTDTDFIEFDEVLKSIANDNHNKRRNSQLNESNYEFNDYMIIDESVVVKNNESDPIEKMFNAIGEENQNTTAEPTVKASNKMVKDLLGSLKTDEYLNVSNNNNKDLSSNIIKEDNYDPNETIQFDAINIMKRDVSSVSNLNLTTEATTTNNTNTSKPITELKSNVLMPLTKIIDDKEQELKDLIKIKENLIQFIKDYNNTELDINKESQKIINTTNTVLSIYNLDIFPEIQFNLRKINPNSLDKLLYKLKRDIYEVIRDVVGIKKLSKMNNLPDDLANLIRAMSLYVRKQGNVTNIIQNGIKLKDDKSLRRQSKTDNANFTCTKQYLIKILEDLDKDMPQTEALSSLSPATRKIMKRVIKNHYSDDFSMIGLRVYDPEYNLTNDLRNVGNKWQVMTANVAASAPADKIYAMKLLHLTLSVDINKLNDALALIDFAHSRRMIPIEGSLGIKLLDKINHGLYSINEKIKVIMKYQSGHENPGRANVDITIKPSKRKSFLKKIRNLLIGSKKDIVELVNNNVPRSQIIKTIAKKKLDDLARIRISEYADTMRKWQNTLNVIPRNKRSLDLSRSQNRMKNIIPKYLRGKLNPAIAAKYSKKTRNSQKEATLKKTERTTVKTKIIPAKLKTDKNKSPPSKRRIKAVSISNRNRSKVSVAKSSKTMRH